MGFRPAAAQVINANDRGWYNAAGAHTPSNNNTYTGLIGATDYRSYFRFSIPASVTCIASAQLELELENYYGSGPGHTATIFDVAPAVVPLLDTTNGSGSGLAIYNDLGSGANYGQVTNRTSANIGSLVTFSLPIAARNNIVAAAGSNFAIGITTTPAGTGGNRGLRYSTGSESRVHRLTLTPCPPSPNMAVSKSSVISVLGSANAFALPGNDVEYSITLTNTGPGLPDTNSVFIYDQVPADVSFYNGDFDGAGPLTGAVQVVTAGTGLTFNPATDLAYSNAAVAPTSFSACTYTPVSGYDPAITYICFNPKGALLSGPPAPQFTVRFRAKIQ